MVSVFERTEKKYIISEQQAKRLLALAENRLWQDRFFESTVISLYFDTDDYRVIRSSAEKPVYKEKLRLRSYNTPDDDSTVFLELKKKYKRIVYKRREQMKLWEADRYINGGKKPKDTQIMREIDHFIRSHTGLCPKVMIAYDRHAYKGDGGLRLTLDRRPRYRADRLDLSLGSDGRLLLDENLMIMEIKVDQSMPVWLADALDELNVFPTSFSKYGTAYKIMMNEKGDDLSA